MPVPADKGKHFFCAFRGLKFRQGLTRKEKNSVSDILLRINCELSNFISKFLEKSACMPMSFLAMFQQIGQSCCPILLSALARRFEVLSTLITIRIRLDAQCRHKDRNDRDRSENSARGQTCLQSAYLTGVSGTLIPVNAHKEWAHRKRARHNSSHQRFQSGRDTPAAYHCDRMDRARGQDEPED